MALSYVTYTGTGPQTDYTFPFLYISPADVFVIVNGVSVAFTFINSSSVRCAVPPAAGATIQVRRLTAKLSVPVDFVDGSNLLERDLDLLGTWTLYQAQESGDVSSDLLGLAGAPLNSAVAAAVQANVSANAAALSAAQVPAQVAAAFVDLAGTTTAAKGAGQIGYDSALAYTGRTVGRKLHESVSVLDYIPVSEHAAIAAYTSTLDVTDYFNAAIGASAVVRVPAGGYRTLRPINMSARRSASAYQGRRLIGDGADRTQINAYTGVYPCIDCTGQSTGAVQGINFRSDNPPAGLTPADCASIGLQMGRGNVAPQCNQLYMLDLRFNLTTDMTRNSGNGTIGICNDSSEHVIADQMQIYANLPLVSHNVMQFAIARSANIPTFGVQYEAAYSGPPISCTIHEWRNMQLIAYDSFRAMWMYQVANVEFPNLYTSTRKLVSLVPAQKESFLLTSCANVMIRCYQEVSGLFGTTYRTDHRYLTIGGDNQNLDITVQRGVSDMGFTNPGVSESSIMLLNSSSLANSRINCNNTVGNYNASGDNLGLATEAVSITGTPNALRNVDFTLDSIFSRTGGGNIFGTIRPYCYNVNSRNYLSGVDYYGSATGAFTPTVRGITAAGVGTYSFQAGTYSKSGRTLTFAISVAWTAHTGTGGMQVVGLPFNSDANVEQAVSVYYDGLTTTAGRQLVCKTAISSGVLQLYVADPSGGGVSGVTFDPSVASLLISGSIVMA